MADISKQEKSERYSCNIDDWLDAVNLVVERVSEKDENGYLSDNKSPIGQKE
jgi:hypothetical protein